MGCTTAHRVRKSCCTQTKIVHFNVQRLYVDCMSVQCFAQYGSTPFLR